MFCGGCLVVGGPSHADDPDFPRRRSEHPAFEDSPLVVVVDDAHEALGPIEVGSLGDHIDESHDPRDDDAQHDDDRKPLPPVAAR